MSRRDRDVGDDFIALLAQLLIGAIGLVVGSFAVHFLKRKDRLRFPDIFCLSRF